MPIHDTLSRRALEAPESGIVAVVNHGRGRAGLIPLWVGEGDLPTPDFICRAAVAGLAAGETFYTWQRGIPELRRALADYHAAHYGRPFDPETFFVTGSGMHSIRLAIDALAEPGDEMVYLSPAWPNFAAAAALAGVVPVPIAFTLSDGAWRIDLGRVADAVGPKTRALFVNSPSNPTGWTADHDTLRALLDIARRAGIWIVADEIYARFHYAGGRAPSFFDVMEEGDRVLFVNSFSKNWSMTGWRVGWIHAPRDMGQVLENLVQYSNSGVAGFMQRGAAAALGEGEPFLSGQIERAARARDILCDALLQTGRVELAKPAGAFYAFFAIDGIGDTRSAAIRLIDETAVGLAPGTAFGAGGDRFLRACFHRRLDQVEAAAERLAGYIKTL